MRPTVTAHSVSVRLPQGASRSFPKALVSRGLLPLVALPGQILPASLIWGLSPPRMQSLHRHLAVCWRGVPTLVAVAMRTRISERPCPRWSSEIPQRRATTLSPTLTTVPRCWTVFCGHWHRHSTWGPRGQPECAGRCERGSPRDRDAQSRPESPSRSSSGGRVPATPARRFPGSEWAQRSWFSTPRAAGSSL